MSPFYFAGMSGVCFVPIMLMQTHIEYPLQTTLLQKAQDIRQKGQTQDNGGCLDETIQKSYRI